MPARPSSRCGHGRRAPPRRPSTGRWRPARSSGRGRCAARCTSSPPRISRSRSRPSALHIARGRRRLAQLGLSDADAERSTAETAAILAEDGPLTRHELAARLRDRGVPVAAEGQAPIHVVRRAALAGVLREVGVSGTYGPLEVDLPDRGEALRELGGRYLAAHAPATVEDFAAWSALPAADVRTAWQGAPPVEGGVEPGGVRLLPAFDEWLLGWASRDLVLPAAHARRVAPGGGIIRPIAIADGRVFGTWRLDRPAGRVVLEAFGRRPPGVAGEIAALSAFVGQPLTVTAAG
jgi:hypothetical protein